FPAQHWIRLAPSNGLDFVSHWVFQHPLDGSLRANWCQLQVSRLPSGTLKVCWPGLPQSHPVIYCLEWDGSKSRGCGLGSSTECTLLLREQDRVHLRVCAYINTADTVEVPGDWQTLEIEEAPQLQAASTCESSHVPLEEPIPAAESFVPAPSEATRAAAAIATPLEAQTPQSPSSDSTGFSGFSMWTVVHHGGVLIREAPSQEARTLGHLAFSKQVRGRLESAGLWLQLDRSELESKEAAWVLVDGSEIGLGRLLEPRDSIDPENAAMATEDDAHTKEDEDSANAEDRKERCLEKGIRTKETNEEEPQEPKPNKCKSKESNQREESKESKQIIETEKVKSTKVSAIKHASTMAEQVVEPVEYLVLSPKLPLYSEPCAASERIEELESTASICGFPGNLSWLRLAKQPEKWAPIKSAKEVFLSPKWSNLKAEKVFSEALEVSWHGLRARSPYVAAYRIEWRLTPGEELPIGQDGDSLKKSGYALSLKPCAILHGLPAGAAVQLRAGVRVAAQSAGEADFRLLGPWKDFTTGSPIPEEDERETARKIDPFGGMRGGCASSQCRGYVADLDAMAFVGANANNLVTTAICVRCGKSFEAHEKVDPQMAKAPKSVKSTSTLEEQPNFAKFQVDQHGPPKTFVVSTLEPSASI
ncbi:D-amino acid dehydrogenase small subunit, partial [Durusdinium trenchii]